MPLDHIGWALRQSPHQVDYRSLDRRHHMTHLGGWQPFPTGISDAADSA